MPHTLIICLRIIGILLVIALIIFGIIYFWPDRSASLQTGTQKTISYTDAVSHYHDTVASEHVRGVLPQNTTELFTHGSKTANAVVMFHGITASPAQFTSLAQRFYNAGYNVYVPLAPEHGTTNPDNHAKVTANELVNYANDAITTATGLGDNVGVVGLSGGGLVATWAAEYRSEVSRALILSPFYEPAVAQAPKWQLPLLRTLYGFHLMPDKFTVADHPGDARFSYSALANYLIVGQNFKSTPTAPWLKQISLVTSASDDQIDLSTAHQIPQKIADTNHLSLLFNNLPHEWNVGHDIVDPGNKQVSVRQTQLYDLYFNSYEGRSTHL